MRSPISRKTWYRPVLERLCVLAAVEVSTRFAFASSGSALQQRQRHNEVAPPTSEQTLT